MSTDTSKPPTLEEADHRAMLDHAFKGKPALKMIFVSEKHSALAIALQDDFRNHVRELIAPDVLPAEMGHA